MLLIPTMELLCKNFRNNDLEFDTIYTYYITIIISPQKLALENKIGGKTRIKPLVLMCKSGILRC